MALSSYAISVRRGDIGCLKEKKTDKMLCAAGSVDRSVGLANGTEGGREEGRTDGRATKFGSA